MSGAFGYAAVVNSGNGIGNAVQVLSRRSEKRKCLVFDPDLGRQREGYESPGLCTIDVDTQNAPGAPVNAGGVFQGAVKLRVKVSTEGAESTFYCDAPRGHSVTVGACDSITIEAFVEPSTASGNALLEYPQRVNASATWGTSRGEMVAQYSPPGFLADVDPGGPYVVIPPRASRVALVTGEVGYTNVFMVFAGAPNVASEVYRASATGPRFSDAVPVVLGARYMRVIAPGSGIVHPVFWLFG